MIRLLLAVSILAAAAETCGLDQLSGPGQASFRGTLTILNRTEREITVTGEGRVVAVPPCDEATVQDFPLNSWNLASPGRDSFHAGGGFGREQAFLVVTNVPAQLERRPDPLPPCDGLVQPAT
jgi:hypothetical protein